ncbi:hypothetical protein OIO90_004607 [Microbotryomycetes sp. JL221]|nr:hypothetical protein OIO90_004607 [Microbotryomycetes sp. JL221]
MSASDQRDCTRCKRKHTIWSANLCHQRGPNLIFMREPYKGHLPTKNEFKVCLPKALRLLGLFLLVLEYIVAVDWDQQAVEQWSAAIRQVAHLLREVANGMKVKPMISVWNWLFKMDHHVGSVHTLSHVENILANEHVHQSLLKTLQRQASAMEVLHQPQLHRLFNSAHDLLERHRLNVNEIAVACLLASGCHVRRLNLTGSSTVAGTHRKSALQQDPLNGANWIATLRLDSDLHHLSLFRANHLADFDEIVQHLPRPNMVNTEADQQSSSARSNLTSFGTSQQPTMLSDSKHQAPQTSRHQSTNSSTPKLLYYMPPSQTKQLEHLLLTNTNVRKTQIERHLPTMLALLGLFLLGLEAMIPFNGSSTFSQNWAGAITQLANLHRRVMGDTLTLQGELQPWWNWMITNGQGESPACLDKVQSILSDKNFHQLLSEGFDHRSKILRKTEADAQAQQLVGAACRVLITMKEHLRLNDLAVAGLFSMGCTDPIRGGQWIVHLEDQLLEESMEVDFDTLTDIPFLEQFRQHHKDAYNEIVQSLGGPKLHSFGSRSRFVSQSRVELSRRQQARYGMSEACGWF